MIETAARTTKAEAQKQNEIETVAWMKKAEEADDTREAAAHNLGEDANAAAGATEGKSETRGGIMRSQKSKNEEIISEDCKIRKLVEEKERNCEG